MTEIIDKALIGICVILIVTCCVLHSRVEYFKGKNSELTMQLEGCTKDVEASNKAEEKSAEVIKEIRTVVKKVPSVCDCYNSPVDSDVLDILRHRNRNKK